MRNLLIRFGDWIMRKLNDQFHQEREWMDGEEQEEWFTKRREYYTARKKVAKEPK